DGNTALVENYTVTNGVANVSVPTTRTGDYDLTVEVIETPFFNSCNATIPVSISKAQTTLTVDQYDEGIYEVINALNNTLLTGTLTQTSNSKALGNKEITVTVEGSDYTVTTDNEGKFIYKYDVTQLAEGLSISIKYNGDELYQASQEYSGTFDIEALDTTIILDEDPLSEVNETTTISGKLTDNYNNPIPNTDVKLEITGVNDIVTVTTDSEGKFSYDVIYNDVLEVTVEASLANAVLYEAEPTTMIFNVVIGPKRTNLTIETGSGSGNNINIVDVTPYFNEVITNGTLIDIFKEPVADATIKILINGEDHSQITDSEGKFTLVYNATQGLTTYNISVEFEGNDAYKPAGEVYTGTFKTEAFDIKVTVDETFPEEILIGDVITLTGSATLQNETLKNNQIVLTIDNTKYTTSTDEEGKYIYDYTVARNGTIPVIANATFANAAVTLGQTSFFVAKPVVNIDLDEIEDTKVYSEITLNGKI
ncbi:MAG: carboxypeptidase regulatory-like domain-containing protein, partial [Methanosphaera sp.]|nr:carboxypeptidase regulatory-like domain-containing protein [Methanosphaera sp.]